MAHAASYTAQELVPGPPENITIIKFRGTVVDLRNIRLLLQSKLKEIKGIAPENDIPEIEFPMELKDFTFTCNPGSKLRTFVSIPQGPPPSRPAISLLETRQVDQHFRIFTIKRKYQDLELAKSGTWAQGTLPSGQNVYIRMPGTLTIGSWFEGLPSDIKCLVCYQFVINVKFPCSVPSATHGICTTCYEYMNPERAANKVVHCVLCRQQHLMEDLQQLEYPLEDLMLRLETPGRKLDFDDNLDSASDTDTTEIGHRARAKLILSTALLRQHIAEETALARKAGSQKWKRIWKKLQC